MEYSFYILYSEHLNNYYIGSSQDVNERIRQHNNSSGSKFTKRAKDWKLVHSEKFGTRSEAQQREYEVKRKKSRKYIEFLIKKS